MGAGWSEECVGGALMKFILGQPSNAVFRSMILAHEASIIIEVEFL